MDFEVTCPVVNILIKQAEFSSCVHVVCIIRIKNVSVALNYS